MKEEEILEEVNYYDKLPVIYWKEILQVQAQEPRYRRRPAKMHRTLRLSGAAWWIEKIFGIPMDKIEFVGVPPEDWDTKTVADLQQQLTTQVNQDDSGEPC